MDAADRSRARLAEAWPLFGLVVRSERLVLRPATDDDLLELMAVARGGIHPPDTMPFAVPWSTMASPEFEQSYFRYHWGGRSSWRPDDWELGLGVWVDGHAIGMQGMQASRFAEVRTVHTGSWLGLASQGHGYGKEMRSAILSLAFDGLGAKVADTEAMLDNAASSGVSRALGYEENGRGGLAPQGELRETQRFRMTVEGWRSRPRPPVTFEGLEACLPLFGVDAPGAGSTG
jgi:RimJ/RimL family protein N-acetyltransferase